MMKMNVWSQWIRMLLLLAVATVASAAQTGKPSVAHGLPSVAHVFVALCDNASQGIQPVPARIGNGDDPEENLYWGCDLGTKTYFRKSKDWQLVKTIKNPGEPILERCVFRHARANAWLIADAYRGRAIKQAVTDFIQAAHGQHKVTVAVQGRGEATTHTLRAGGEARLVAYVGHDGLMDFTLDVRPGIQPANGSGKDGTPARDAIILACKSRDFFKPYLAGADIRPLLWTTELMAPEAYTLKAALDGWIISESPEQIRTRAAQAYAQYQKCGVKAARGLLVTGW